MAGGLLNTCSRVGLHLESPFMPPYKMGDPPPMCHTPVPYRTVPQTYEPSPGNTGTWHDYLMSNHIKFAQDNDFVLARGHTLEVGHWGVY